MSVQRMCALGGVSRSGFYRSRRAAEPGTDADMELRDQIQRIALEFPSYGWPRMTAELRRRGWAVNHTRVYRLMCQDNLLCLRRPSWSRPCGSGDTLNAKPRRKQPTE